MSAAKRIGIFGGTFDPVHLGHLIVAEQCREQGRLDAVWFIPAARPPHKPDQALTAFHHRLEMLALAVAGYPVFKIDPLEQERPGPSYTVDTLAALHERLSREGRILDPGRWDLCTLFDVNYRPTHMSPRELQEGMYWLTERLYSDACTNRRRGAFREEYVARARHRHGAPRGVSAA